MRTFKTALVTGGAQRIGQAICLHLAAGGYGIALHYHRSAKAAQATALRIRKAGGHCEIFGCDLADARAAQKLVPAVKKKLPGLDLLVNNASIFEKSTLAQPGLSAFDRHWAINFRAPYILSRHFARSCPKGHIINILDTNITKYKTSYFDYLLTKKTLAEFTQLAAVELGPRIRVNGIAPGLILPPAGQGERYLQKRARRIPLRKKGNSDAVLKSLDFLLTNSYVTGQIVFADGGEALV